MAEFPKSPQAPDEFFERTIPAMFAARRRRDALTGSEVSFGVLLEGKGGGEWIYALREGKLEVRAGSRAEAALTLIQSVADWRGALWEQRGGIVAERALGLLRGSASPANSKTARAAAGLADPALLGKLAGLDALLRTVVTDAPAGDWSLSFKFGPGEIPAEATTTVSIHYEDADALARRELKPLEAFLAGRIGIAGNLVFAMKLQALAAGFAKA